MLGGGGQNPKFWIFFIKNQKQYRFRFLSILSLVRTYQQILYTLVLYICIGKVAWFAVYNWSNLWNALLYPFVILLYWLYRIPLCILHRLSRNWPRHIHESCSVESAGRFLLKFFNFYATTIDILQYVQEVVTHFI